ncbi:hypothetical protein A9Q84_13180 [Halobacteriovorax marinus]|uniref:Glutamine amidotransferase type-2 domain-containing protein n=1 Tax=Halobacteriovorax marinus TaxID=97084 RepID=A0A1Y5F8R8_9BACT|nr:hypothetical protein A9Q84_13180 [Halobacteriovorax marinus]
MCAIVWLPFSISDGEDFHIIKEKMKARGTSSFHHLESFGSTLLHARFSTNGMSDQLQPKSVGEMSFCFNGQLNNWQAGEVDTLAEVFCETTLAKIETLPFKNIGTFSLIVRFKDGIFAMRDPFGRRPLYLLEKEEHSLITSEPFMVNHFGEGRVSELRPGEWVKLSSMGVVTKRGRIESEVKTCFLENAYFMNKETRVLGVELASSRELLGELLGQKLRGISGEVVPIPDGAFDFANGLAQVIGRAVLPIIKKNQFRTFIERTNRAEKIKAKYEVVGKVPREIILVDDSLVSGSTVAYLTKLLKQHGAERVTIAIGSPRIISPCVQGMGFINPNDIYHSSQNVQRNWDDEFFLEVSDYQDVFQTRFCADCIT